MALIDEIMALPAPVRAQKNTQLIAALLSESRVKVVERMVTERTIWSALGAIEGNAFLTAFSALAAADLPVGHPLKPHQPVFVKCIEWLGKDGLDFGNAEIRAMISGGLVATGCLDADQAAVLMSLAEVPDPVDELSVRRECWSDNGDWTV